MGFAKKNLENLQIEAARIVTGLSIFTKSENLYKENGWTLTGEKDENYKYFITFSINKLPDYLCNFVSPSEQSTHVYPLINCSFL